MSNIRASWWHFEYPLALHTWYPVADTVHLKRTVASRITGHNSECHLLFCSDHRISISEIVALFKYEFYWWHKHVIWSATFTWFFLVLQIPSSFRLRRTECPFLVPDPTDRDQ